MNHILKMSNAGGFTSATRYPDMLAGNTVWNPYSPTGSYDALATVTPSGSTGTITFANIPQTYTHLQLRIQARGTSTAGGYYTSVGVSLNGDTTATNYYHHYLGGNGSGAIWSSANTYLTNSLINIPNALNTANVFAGGVIDILDYNSTVKNKTLRSINGADLNSTVGFPYSGAIFLASMLWNSTAAVNSITFTADATYSTNFAAGSSFALYGVKA
jgi:hypothetical protein